MNIRKLLASKPDSVQLISKSERIGAEFDEEIDKARRDEGRGRAGGGGS
jgi:hypothetical protein